MKIIYLITIVLVFSCSNDKEKKRQSNFLINKKTKEPREKLNQFDTLKEKEIIHQKESVCEKFSFEKYRNDLFTDYDLIIDDNFNLNNHSDSIYLTTKSIKLHSNSQLKQIIKFKNLESLSVGVGKISLIGMSFPKLKSLSLWGTIVKIDSKTLNNLEYLHASKSNIICSDKKLNFQNLKVLELLHSKLNNINLNKMSSLQMLNLSAYRGDTINLRDFNFDNNPCLQYLKIIDDYDKIKGIPLNVEKVNYSRFYFYNRDINLEEEKTISYIKKGN